MTIRVLIADDHALLRDGLRVILEAHGELAVVGEAATGREAVSESRRLEPDVVVMDISMPDLNGLEATRELTASDVPPKVVVLSMHLSAELVFQALKAGARGYVVKESAAAEVVEAVRIVSGGHRYLSPRVADLVVDSFARLYPGGAAPSPLERLSGRERQVLQLVTEGRSSADIGRTLLLSPKTVDTYRSRLMKKLGVGDLASLIRFAVAHGLTPST